MYLTCVTGDRNAYADSPWRCNQTSPARERRYNFGEVSHWLSPHHHGLASISTSQSPPAIFAFYLRRLVTSQKSTSVDSLPDLLSTKDEDGDVTFSHARRSDLLTQNESWATDNSYWYQIPDPVSKWVINQVYTSHTCCSITQNLNPLVFFGSKEKA